MIQYIVEDFTEGERKYSISYMELRELYHKFIDLSDEEFMKQLPEIIHFSCVMCWFKGLPNNLTIGDCGIIHELVHIMTNNPINKYHFKKVRKQFIFILKLA